MSRSVDIDEAKAKVSELVDAAVAGEKIFIARNGRARARLVACRVWDSSPEGRGFCSDPDLLVPDDFDEPLPAEMLDTFSS